MDSFRKNILLPSLDIIRHDHRIKRFYFFPWLLSVVFLSILLLYQVAYTSVVLLERKEAALEIILQLFHNEYLSQMLIVAIIFIVFYLILIPIFEWALIQYINNKNIEWSASRSDSMWVGIFRFYALFEFNNIFNMFKFISIVNGYLFSLRFLWVEYIRSLSIFFFIAFIFSIIINIVVAYARYEIVLNKKWVFEAIWISSQISLINIKTTLKLYVFMFIMNIKVMLNFIIFLIFPLIAIFITGFLTSSIFTTIALFLLAAVFVFLLLILWYMTAVLDIFTTAIWYHAYKEGKGKLDGMEDS